MIKIFRSATEKIPVETHEFSGLFSDFLQSQSEHFDESKDLILVSVNSKSVPGYMSLEIGEEDDVRIYPKPKDDISNIVNSAFSPLTWLVNQLIDIPKPEAPETVSQRQQGTSISVLGSSNDYASPTLPIPVIAGEHRIYPKLTQKPFRYFDSPTVVKTVVVMAIADGEHEYDTSEILVGDTKLDDLGSYATYEIRAANEAVSDDYYHVLDEVGSSDSGNAGLNLSTIDESPIDATQTSISGESHTLDVQLPAGWQVGTILKVFVQIVCDAQSAIGGRTSFVKDDGDGTWANQDLALFEGYECTVKINDTEYDLIVHTYDPGTPQYILFSDENGDPFGEFDNAGNVKIDIRNRGCKNRISSIDRSTNTIEVNALLEDGTLDLDPPGWHQGITLAPDFEYSAQTEGSVGEFKGPFSATKFNESTNAIDNSFYFPNGLGQYDETTGELLSHTVVIVVALSYDGGTTWSETEYTITEKTPNAFGVTERIVVFDTNPPLIKVRRKTAKGDNNFLDSVNWYECRSLVGAISSYPCETIKVELRSGDFVSKLSESKISLVPRRIYSGDVSASDNINKAFYSITDDLNINRAKIDETTIDSLQSTWTSRGDDFNYVFTEQAPLIDQLNTVLGAGMAEVKMSSGLISAVREGVKSVSSIVSPHDQVTPLQTSFKMASEDEITGVDVTYIDANDWTEKVVECRVSGVTADKIESFTIPGVTTEVRAWRIGMRRLRKYLYQRYNHDVTTEQLGMLYEYKDIVRVCDDIPGTTQSALVIDTEVSGANTILTLSEKIDTSGYSATRCILRDEEGVATAEITPVSVTETTVTVATSSLGFTPVIDNSQEYSRITVYDTDMPGYDMLITEVVPGAGEDMTVQVRGVMYSAAFYADDDNSPP